MEKIFVDTGGWCGLFVDNDQCHKEAVSIYKEIQKRKMEIYTSDYILDETITLIKYRSDSFAALKAGKALFCCGYCK